MPLAHTRPVDGRSIMPSSVNRLPTVSGMLQAKSSLKTKGVAARYTQTEPPKIVATSTPKEAASARPSTALPRVTIPEPPEQQRAEDSLSSARPAPWTQGVKSPSNLLVSRRIGILRSDGKIPK